MKCFAKYCTNKTTPGFKNIGFFRFPADEDLQVAWKKFCGFPDHFEITASCRVCSFHFLQEDVYFASGKGKIMRRRTAVPVYDCVPQIADFTLEEDDLSADVSNASSTIEELFVDYSLASEQNRLAAGQTLFGSSLQNILSSLLEKFSAAARASASSRCSMELSIK